MVFCAQAIQSWSWLPCFGYVSSREVHMLSSLCPVVWTVPVGSWSLGIQGLPWSAVLAMGNGDGQQSGSANGGFHPKWMIYIDLCHGKSEHPRKIWMIISGGCFYLEDTQSSGNGIWDDFTVAIMGIEFSDDCDGILDRSFLRWARSHSEWWLYG